MQDDINPGEGQAPNAATSDNAGQVPDSVDHKAIAGGLQARLDRAEADLAKVRSENASRRVSEREAGETAANEAAKRGDFEATLQIRNERIKELEALEPDAKAYQSYRSSVAESVAADLADESLPKYFRDSLEGHDVVKQRDLLNAFKSSMPNAPALPPAKPPAGGSPPPSAPRAKDWAALNATGGTQLQTAMRADPDGWANHLAGTSSRRRSSHGSR